MAYYQNLPKHIMPELNERTLCFMVDGPMLAEEYKTAEQYIDAMLESQGELRILVYFKNFSGWEEAATRSDADFTLRYSSRITKLAAVQPPAIFIAQMKFKEPLQKNMALRYYEESQLQEAIAWINAP